MASELKNFIGILLIVYLSSFRSPILHFVAVVFTDELVIENPVAFPIKPELGMYSVFTVQLAHIYIFSRDVIETLTLS